MDGNNMNNMYTTEAPTQTAEYTYAEETYTEAPATGKNGLALWGMILGIASVVCCTWGPILGLVGLILSIKGKKKLPAKKGMSMTGIITSICGMVIGVVVIIILIVAMTAGVLSEYM